MDGNTATKIYEVKTYNINKEFKVTKAYRMQVNVEMYASGIHNACIVAYGLEPEDYINHYRDIDMSRISYHEIEYDAEFIEQYKSKLDYLTMCLKCGTFPM